MKKHLLFSYFYASIFCATITGMEMTRIEQAFYAPPIFSRICLFTNSFEAILNVSEICKTTRTILFPTNSNCSFEEQTFAHILHNPAMISSLGNKMYKLVLNNKEGIFSPIKDLIGTYHENTLELKRVKIKESTVRLLLQSGANPNIGDAYSTPLLHNVCGSGHLEVAKLLLEYGAKVNAVDRYGRTALFEAIHSIRYTQHDWQGDKDGRFLANGKNKRDLLCLLLSYGIDVNKKSILGSALESACLLGDCPTVKFLIQNDAEVTKSCITLPTGYVDEKTKKTPLLCILNYFPISITVTCATGALLGYTTTYFTEPESLASYLIFVSLLPNPFKTVRNWIHKKR